MGDELCLVCGMFGIRVNVEVTRVLVLVRVRVRVRVIFVTTHVVGVPLTRLSAPTA